jgi:integrase
MKDKRIKEKIVGNKTVYEFRILVNTNPRQEVKRRFTTYKEAEMELNQVILDRNLGNFFKRSIAKNPRFEILAHLFLQKAKLEYSEKTYITYRQRYNDFLSVFANYTYSELTPYLLFENFIKWRDKPFLYNEIKKLGKTIINHAIKFELVDTNKKNPFNSIESINIEKLGLAKEHRVLTLKETKCLLEHAQNTELYPLIATAIYTGIRQGELLALKWADIDLENYTIKVCRQIQNGKTTERLKTAKSRRTVDLCDELIKILKIHKKQSILKRNLHEYIFVTPNGNFIDPRNLLRKFKSLLKKVFGDEDYIRWHDLRASYTSILVDAGVNIKYLQCSLGHSNPKTTMESYTRVLKTTSSKARKVLSKVFSG